MILNNMKCMQRFLLSPSSKLVIEERIWDRSRIRACLFHSFSRSARFTALMASVTAARLLPTMVDCDSSYCTMHMLPCFEPIASVSLSRAYSSRLPLFQWENHCTGNSLDVSILESSNVKLLAECSALIRHASMRGDNVGVDEHPLSISELSSIVSKPRTKAFVFTDDDVVEAVLIITPCPHSRSTNPTLCSIRMIASQHLQGTSGKHFWTVFARSVLDILKRHTGNLYSACVTDVFVTCIDVVLGLRHAGFNITACIPACGLLSRGRGCDYVSSYVMYAELGDTPAQVFRSNTSSNMDEQMLASICIRSLPYMPVTSLSLRTHRVTLRKLHNDEIPLFYETAQDAANDSLSIGSYGTDEFTDLLYFAKEYVDNQYVTVIELSETSQIIGFMSFGPSTFSRSSKNLINDANVVLLREFRHNGWASILLAYNASMSKDAGFLASQGEAAVTNLGSVMSMLRLGCISNGILPKAIYFDQSGWTDLCLNCLYLKQFPSMLDINTWHHSR